MRSFLIGVSLPKVFMAKLTTSSTLCNQIIPWVVFVQGFLGKEYFAYDDASKKIKYAGEKQFAHNHSS